MGDLDYDVRDGVGLITLNRPEKANALSEEMILGLAAKHGGYLTLAMVVLESSCTATQAEMAMEQMIRQGFAQPELMDDGTVRYRFGGLIDGGRGGS